MADSFVMGQAQSTRDEGRMEVEEAPTAFGAVAASATEGSQERGPATEPAGPSRWYCHTCAEEIGDARAGLPDGHDPACPQCQGEFVEQLEGDNQLEAARAWTADDHAEEDEDMEFDPGAEQQGHTLRSETWPGASGGGVSFRGGSVGGPYFEFRISTSDGLGGMNAPQSFMQHMVHLLHHTMGAGQGGGAQIQFRTVPGGEGGAAADPRSPRNTALSMPIEAILNQALGLHGNPGDYVLGDAALHNIISELMQNDPNRHGNPPAAQEAIDRLPVVLVPKEDVAISTECAVCREVYKEGDKAMQMPCGHMFCSTCLVPWLQQRNTCPTCRFELPAQQQ
eukprot:jgi/Chlat1/6692/Chrsp49S06169